MAQDLLSDSRKREIIERLTERKVRTQCPMCGHNDFLLADGYFNHIIQADLSAGFVIGGPTIPTVAIVCKNCGFTSQHALGALGLLGHESEEAKK